MLGASAFLDLYLASGTHADHSWLHCEARFAMHITAVPDTGESEGTLMPYAYSCKGVEVGRSRGFE